MTFERLNPGTSIAGLEGATVADFWAWAYSDILTNVSRGMFAEFLVGSALGVVDSLPPAGWEDFDLLYRSKKIEVKSSPYVQSWDQARSSTPVFGVAGQRIWDEITNDWLPERKRPSDCYVFCLYSEKQDRQVVRVLDTDRWDFYVIPTRQINETLNDQKAVRLSVVKNMSETVKIGQLRERVDLAMGV